MRELIVERPGLLALIVDRGRRGHRASGIGWCEAMDLLALTLANRVLGNGGDAAAIEVTLGGAVFTFTAPTRFALAGAHVEAVLDERSVERLRVHEARAGARLTLGAPREGVRTIVAVEGGFDVAIVLGSRTTDMRAGLGGHEGRALRRGDRIPIGAPHGEAGISIDTEPPWNDREVTIRVLPAPEFARLAQRSQALFWNSWWSVGHESNRMAYRLHGPVLGYDAGAVRSHAVFPGVIQLPPRGEPMVLLCDCQTTGGYPKVGVVIEADIWRFAQLRIGARVRFEASTLEAANAATAALRTCVQ